MPYEIDLENPTEKLFWENQLGSSSTLTIISTDRQDKDKTYYIPTKDIVELLDDDDGLQVWWKVLNPIEGNRWITNSAHFRCYIFTL